MFDGNRPDLPTVTRRRFLAWTGCAAAAATVAAGCSTDDQRLAGQQTAGTTEDRWVSLALPTWVGQEAKDLTLVTAAAEFAVTPHDRASRRLHESGNGAFRLAEPGLLTHYVSVEPDVPGAIATAADCAVPALLYAKLDGKREILGYFMFVPRTAMLSTVDAALQSDGELYREDWRLQRVLGRARTDLLQAADVVDAFDLMHLYADSAVSLVFTHPEIGMIDGTGAAVTKSVLCQTPALAELDESLAAFGRQIRGPYGELVPMARGYDAQGRPIPDLVDPFVGRPDWVPPPDFVKTEIPPEVGQQPAESMQLFVEPGAKWRGREIPPELVSNLRNTLAASANDSQRRLNDEASLGVVLPPGDPVTDDPEQLARTMAGKRRVTTSAAAPGTTTAAPADAGTGAQALQDAAGGTGDYGNVRWSMSPGDQTWTGGMRAEIREVRQEGATVGIKLRLYNNYLRYVVCGAQYFDARSLPIMPPKLEGVVEVKGAYSPAKVLDPTWTTRSQILESIPTVMGIPVFNQNYRDIDLYLPPGCTKSRLVALGPGQDKNWRDLFWGIKRTDTGEEVVDDKGKPVLVEAYPDKGSPPWMFEAWLVTSIASIGLPAIMLIAQAVIATKEFRKITPPKGTDPTLMQLNKDAGITLTGYTNHEFVKMLKGNFQASNGFNILYNALKGLSVGVYGTNGWAANIVAMGTGIINFLFMYLFGKVLENYVKAAAASKVGQMLPIVGIAYTLVSVAASAAELAQASATMGTAPLATSWDVEGTYGCTVTVKPGGTASPTFSKSAAAWVLKVQYQGSTDSTTVVPEGYSRKVIVDEKTKRRRVEVAVVKDFSGGPRSEPIVIKLPDIKFGSDIRYTIEIQSKDGHVVGTAATDFLLNTQLDKIPTAVNLTVQTRAVPVNEESTYERRWTTAVAGGKYVNSEAQDIPGTTVTAPFRLGGIVASDGTGLVDYVYARQQRWFVRQLMGSENPGKAEAELGMALRGNPPLLAIDRLAAAGPGARNYLLEPVAEVPGGVPGYVVRALDLSPQGITVDRRDVYGYFQGSLHSVELTPGGLIAALSTSRSTISMLTPAQPDETVTDLQRSVLAVTSSGPGNRLGTVPGLLSGPVGLTVAGTGALIVLEQGAKRLQSFDMFGNPMLGFAATSRSNSPDDYYARLEPDLTYLDVGADGEGFVFVLGYSGAGADPKDYVVDVFAPNSGERLFRADRVNAGRMSVGYFRDVFTLNFQAIPALAGEAGTQPSVSIWTPRTPNPG